MTLSPLNQQDLDSAFLHTLATTCEKDEYLREDGKKLHIWDRVIDFFCGRKRHDHFASICTKLESCIPAFQELQQEEQMAILGRLHQIQNKIARSDVRSQCSAIVRKLERAVFRDEKEIPHVVEALFSDFSRAVDAHSLKGMSHKARELAVIIDYHPQNVQLIKTISTHWKNISEQCFQKKTYADIETVALRTLAEKLLLAAESLPRGVQYKDGPLEHIPKVMHSLCMHAIKQKQPECVHRYLDYTMNVLEAHSGDSAFVHDTLQSLDTILNEAVFAPTFVNVAQEKPLGELKKIDMLRFRKVFELCEQYIPLLEDKKLALSLKVKCANLPCPLPRSYFPNLFLSAKDQLDVVIQVFQKEEQGLLEKLLVFLENNHPPAHDLSRLAKLVGATSHLSKEAKTVLRKKLAEKLGESAVANWDDYHLVLKCFEKQWMALPSKEDSLIEDLGRALRAKIFFESQMNLPEQLIAIPKWYHATPRMSAEKIIASNKILVSQGKWYKGAWISTQRESATDYGTHVFSFTERVENVDASPSIKLKFREKRWRGLQKPIPLTEHQGGSNMAVMAVPSQSDKVAKKIDKMQMVTLLQKHGFPHSRVVSVKQLDYMHRHIRMALGVSNLSDDWYGPGKSSSAHQLKMREMISSSVHPGILQSTNNENGPEALARVLQQVVLPLYKEPMPENPTYLNDTTGSRIACGYFEKHFSKKHIEQVKNKKSSARDTHGAMHAVRVTMWSQLLVKLYKELGRDSIDNPLLLGVAAAFHDSAREGEGIDRWDGESAELLRNCLTLAGVDKTLIPQYVQSIKEKDPAHHHFSTDIQRIVHDADCLEIMRVKGKWAFNPRYLCFYPMCPEKKGQFDALIDEIGSFISLTESKSFHAYLEHNSDDFYGDMMKLLYRMRDRFPNVYAYMKDEMPPAMSENIDRGEQLFKRMNA